MLSANIGILDLAATVKDEAQVVDDIAMDTKHLARRFDE
jgi:hypothetical protein